MFEPKEPSRHPHQSPADKEAPSKQPGMMDPLAMMVEDLAHNAQILASIFNEKTRRAEDLSAHLPVDQKPLPDTVELKAVIDAQAQAIQVALAYRNEQRQSMMFQSAQRQMSQKRERAIGFGKKDETPVHPAPKSATPGLPKAGLQ